MQVGDKVYDRKSGKTYKVGKLSSIPADDKDVAVIVTTTNAVFFYDDLFVLKRKSDGFFGWLFGR